MGDLKPLKILLAEDNKVNQILTLGLLRSLGYSADLASNGKFAIEAVESHDYDLVLMDCQLPIVDGFTAARHIKEKLKARTIIVAYTAHTSELEMARCKEAGMPFALTKPLSIESLTSLLKTVSKLISSSTE